MSSSSYAIAPLALAYETKFVSSFTAIANVNKKVNGSIAPVSFIIALHKIYREVTGARKRPFGQNKMNVDSSSLNHFHASVRIFMCVGVLVPICAYTWNVESYTHPHLE